MRMRPTRADVSRRATESRERAIRMRSRAEALERRTLLSLTPAGEEFRVNTTTPGIQRDPAIAVDTDGDFVVVWSGYGPGSGFNQPDIFAQRFNAAGAPQGGQFRVNTYTTGTQDQPVVAMSSTGDFVVAWQSDDQDGDDFGVYAQRFDAGGVPQGGEFRVNAYTTGKQYVPDVAMDADGDFVIVWERFAVVDGGVYAQRYNAGGAPQGDEFRVTPTAFQQATPSVAMDGDGDIVVAWMSVGQDGSGSAVYARRFDAAGAPQGGEFRVNTYTTGDQRTPSVARDAGGDFVIVWGSVFNQDGSAEGIYAQRYDASGVKQGAEVRVNTYTTGMQFAPAVAMDADGDFAIAWVSNGQDGFGYGIYAQAYNDAGTPQGPEFRVNTFTTHGQLSPAVAMEATGDAVIAWESDLQDNSSLGVYAQRYASAPTVPAVSASAFLYETPPQRLSFTFNQDVSASLGLDDLVVQTLPGGPNVAPGSLSYDAATNTAIFAFGDVLPDSNYRATLLAAGVSGPGGAMAADHVLDFFFLRGDANHDSRVNLQDFNILASNFGQSDRTFSQGDFNYDGRVNLQDFNVLAARFGQSVAPATSLVRTIAERDKDDPRNELLD